MEQQNHIILELFSRPVHPVIPSAHKTLMRARIKLWHTWKRQAFIYINLSHHLGSPDPQARSSSADGLWEPQDCVETIHCYANTQLLLNLTLTLLFQSTQRGGRNKGSCKEASIKSRQDFCRQGKGKQSGSLKWSCAAPGKGSHSSKYNFVPDKH